MQKWSRSSTSQSKFAGAVANTHYAAIDNIYKRLNIVPEYLLLSRGLPVTARKSKKDAKKIKGKQERDNSYLNFKTSERLAGLVTATWVSPAEWHTCTPASSISPSMRGLSRAAIRIL